eukprot:scaffold434_cov186-Pinguiococcus_pyrenoidosus.AAC.134
MKPCQLSSQGDEAAITARKLDGQIGVQSAAEHSPQQRILRVLAFEAIRLSEGCGAARLTDGPRQAVLEEG